MLASNALREVAEELEVSGEVAESGGRFQCSPARDKVDETPSEPREKWDVRRGRRVQAIVPGRVARPGAEASLIDARRAIPAARGLPRAK